MEGNGAGQDPWTGVELHLEYGGSIESSVLPSLNPVVGGRIAAVFSTRDHASRYKCPAVFAASMSQTERQTAGHLQPHGPEYGSLISRIVLIELVEAGTAISVSELADRTLLSERSVEASLEHLTEIDVCRQVPGDDRRPPQYRTV